VKFTALTQFNLGTLAYGQALLNEINIRNANPNLRPPFITRDAANVGAMAGDGYRQGIVDLSSQAVNTANFVQQFQGLANANTATNTTTGSAASINSQGANTVTSN
jgi:hypothetical protein